MVFPCIAGHRYLNSTSTPAYSFPYPSSPHKIPTKTPNNLSTHGNAAPKPLKFQSPNAFVLHTPTFPHFTTRFSHSPSDNLPVNTFSSSNACMALCVVLSAMCGRMRFSASPVIRTLLSKPGSSAHGSAESLMAVMKGEGVLEMISAKGAHMMDWERVR